MSAESGCQSWDKRGFAIGATCTGADSHGLCCQETYTDSPNDDILARTQDYDTMVFDVFQITAAETRSIDASLVNFQVEQKQNMRTSAG